MRKNYIIQHEKLVEIFMKIFILPGLHFHHITLFPSIDERQNEKKKGGAATEDHKFKITGTQLIDLVMSIG